MPKISGVNISGGSNPTTYRVALTSNCSLGQTALRYLPFNGINEQTAPNNYLVLLPAPADGKLVSISAWSQSGGGSSTMGLHINGSTTAASTDTQTLSTNSCTTFTFSSGNTFSLGNNLAFSITSTSNPNGFTAIIILELDY